MKTVQGLQCINYQLHVYLALTILYVSLYVSSEIHCFPDTVILLDKGHRHANNYMYASLKPG